MILVDSCVMELRLQVVGLLCLFIWFPLLFDPFSLIGRVEVEGDQYHTLIWLIEQEMGVLSNKIHWEELKAGDHIYSWRQAYIYAHHGHPLSSNSHPFLTKYICFLSQNMSYQTAFIDVVLYCCGQPFLHTKYI